MIQPLRSVGSSLLLLALGLVLGACGDVAPPPTGDPCPSGQLSPSVFLSPAPGDPPAGLAAQCLETAPTRDASGYAECVVISSFAGGGKCSCDPAQGLVDVAAEHAGAIKVAMSAPAAASAGWDCFCEVPQLQGAAGLACRSKTTEPVTDDQSQPVHGYCYVDPGVDSTSNAELVKNCPASESRALRFAGTAAATPSSKSRGLTMVCSTGTCGGA